MLDDPVTPHPSPLAPRPSPPAPRRSWARKSRDAFRGVKEGVRGQSSFYVHFFVAATVVVAGVVLRVNLYEWCLLVLCIAGVIAAELFNSALESMARAITKESDPYLGNSLDIGSAAVLVAAVGASIVGAIIFSSRLSCRPTNCGAGVPPALCSRDGCTTRDEGILEGPLIPAAPARHAARSGPSPRLIVNYGGGGWKDNQVQEPCILANPKDPAKLIMFYSGATTQAHGSVGSLGKAWANVSDPFTWHEDASNPILRGVRGTAFDESAYIRLDSLIYNESLDEYWIYYTGNSAKTHRDAIGLATCPAGKDGYSGVVAANIKRYADNPILSPKGQGRLDERCVSQGAVFREGELWYMLYSYRTATKTLPGVSLATSRDGERWTKTPGPDLLTAAPESLYLEWHQVYKIGGLYVMLFEGYNGGARWRANVATSSSLTTGWKKMPANLIDQTTWPNYSDETFFHVATPAIYKINGKWRLYFQAAHSGPYIVQHWAMWGIECDDLIQNLSAGTRGEAKADPH